MRNDYLELLLGNWRDRAVNMKCLREPCHRILRTDRTH